MKTKNKILIAVIITILASALFILINQDPSDKRIISLLGTDKLPIEEVNTDYVVNMNRLKEVVGDADYVFVGKVEDYVDTLYGELEGNIPTTIYSVKVVENIKGELITDKNIEIRKSGGINRNGSKFIILKDDQLPMVKEYYIFSAYGLGKFGLIANGQNTSIHIENSTDYKENEQYNLIVKAYQRQVVSERTRKISKYDVNYEK